MTSKLEKYYKTIPSLYQPQANELVNALIQAWAESDETIVEQLEETKKQLYVERASNEFLSLLGSSVDVTRPLLIALSDVYYRQLIEKMSFAPKVIKKTIYDVLDIFWGPTYSRANVTSTTFENYNFGSPLVLNGQVTFTNGSAIVSGAGTLFTSEVAVNNFIKLNTDNNTVYAKVARVVDDTKLYLVDAYAGTSKTGTANNIVAKTLIIKVDNDTSTITLILSPAFFADNTSITAQEIANAIENESARIGSSTVKTIASNGKFYVNLRTATTGMLGEIQVTGGTANAILNFPTDKKTIYDLETSTLIYEINPREMILAVPNLVARLERTLRGAHWVHDNISGIILSVDNIAKTVTVNFNEAVTLNQLAGQVFTQGVVSYTIVSHPAGQNNVVVQFSAGDDLSFLENSGSQTFAFGANLNWPVNHNLNQLRPNITIYDNFNRVILPNNIDNTDANNSVIEFSSAQGGRVSLSTQNHTFNQASPNTSWAINHALNSKYLNINVYDSSNQLLGWDTIEAVDANNIELGFLSNQSGWIALMIPDYLHTQGVTNTVWTIVHNLGSKYVHATVYDSSDHVVIPDKIEVVDKNTLRVTLYSTDTGRVAINDTGLEGTSSFSIINDAYPSAFIYDLESPFAITGTRTLLKQNISDGDKIINLTVDDASDFPNEEGFVLFNFGRQNQEGPVPYKARPDNQVLVIDPLYTFKNNHLLGDMINYLSGIVPYIPRDDGTDYPSFVTGTEEVLEVVQSILLKLKAVGVVVRWIIKEPEYNFSC